MKYLTAPYLTLMHAFHTRADSCLEQYKDQPQYSLHALMQEYCTLRIDGGRQSGKTEAVSQFADEWISNGGDVVVLAEKVTYANDTKDRIIGKHFRQLSPRYSATELRSRIITASMRDFLSDDCNKFRGRSLSRILFIIEEPIRIPELYKFYDKWYTDIRLCHISSGREDLPFFFVMGIQ